MTRTRTRLLFGLGLLVALVLAVAVSYYASSKPDGLERVATDKDFAKEADEHSLSDSPFADYGTEGVENERLSIGIAGAAGTAVVLVVAAGLAYLVRSRSPDATPDGADVMSADRQADGIRQPGDLPDRRAGPAVEGPESVTGRSDAGARSDGSD